MKTSLQFLKTELKRLSDVNELKKELNRLATEVRTFDFSQAVSPARRERLEKHYKTLRATLGDLQTKLDTNFEKISLLIRASRQTQKTSAKKAASPATKRARTKSAKAKPASSKPAAKKTARRSKKV